ncbi:MAG: xanthine dehydrogenase [Bradyrhizobium sp.]|nr:xanthine dehydrogenase [Bradyrhizobium sp.]
MAEVYPSVDTVVEAAQHSPYGNPSGEERWIGVEVPRNGAARFVSGKVAYAADEIEPGSLFLTVLRSPHAHARILNVDVNAAVDAPGVVDVMTGKDARTCSFQMPTRVPRERFPGAIEVWCLAANEVLYVGQPVVAIVSERQADGEAARELVRVEYELLDAVLDAASAVLPGATLTRSEWPTNIVAQDRIRLGDVDTAIRSADCVVKGKMAFGPATSAPIEPRCYIASWDARSERLLLRGTMQQPHPTRWMLAQALGLSEAQIRVSASTMGGTFGLKMVGHPEEVLVSLFSRRLERPVAFRESRQECFLANAREQTHEFEIAAMADGKIVAFRDELIADVGTIAGGGGWLMATVTPTVLPTVYDIPNCAIDSKVVTTNKPPWQGVRGYGKETANVVMERAIELISAELQLDSIEVRRRNLLPKSAFPHRMPSGHNLDSGDYEGALDQLLGIFPYNVWQARKNDADPLEHRIGIGIAFELTPEGASFPGSMPSGFETSTVTIEPSGVVRVATSVTSPGSGNETGIAQLVAEVLGLDPRKIFVVQGDTDVTPFGGGNTSSRSLMFGGAAAVIAARELRSRIETCAATLLQAKDEDFIFADGSIALCSDPDRSVAFTKAVSTIYTHAYSTAADVELPLQSTKTYRAKNVRHVPDEFGRISSYPSFPYSVHAAAVEVDSVSGQVRVLDYAGVHDCGIVVNPGLVEGQFKGAIAMGIGAALWEELLFDDAGATRTDRFKAYVLPRSTDLPRFRIGHRCTPSPFHPLGTKGAGESGFGGAMAVIANAVADALGTEGSSLQRLPCKPDRLIELIGQTPS